MPQVFQIVCCYQCTTHQVKQQSKSPKWACKLCGAKQSLKKVIFEGSAKDCRENTQKLNAMKAQQQYQVVLDLQNGFTSQTEETIAKAVNSPSESADANPNGPGLSQWSKFLDKH